MKPFLFAASWSVLLALSTSLAPAQEADPGRAIDDAKGATKDFIEETQEKVGEIARQVDQSPQAKEVSAGILQPIYQLAEWAAFPLFHWTAFMLMTAGVVSFALQLVLGKLVVLARMSLSFKEILADLLGLVISLIGLMLTTQAAAENSTFTTSPAAVLSAAGAGVLAGLIFYWWGQKEELQAAFGRRKHNKS